MKTLIALMSCACLLGVSAEAAYAQSSTVQKSTTKKKSAPGAKPAPGAKNGSEDGKAAAKPGAERPPEPKTIIKAKHGDWEIACQTRQVPEAVAKKISEENKVELPAPVNGFVPIENCTSVQTVRAKESEKFGGTIVIVRAKDKDKKDAAAVRVQMPFGVFLPTGVGLEVDGKALIRFTFTRCLPGPGCLASGGINNAALEEMKKGKGGNLIVSVSPGTNVSLPLSLNGFTKAFSSL